MPIAGHKPLTQVNTQPSLPTIEPKNHKGIIYDDKNVPLHSLIAYISGAPMSVDWYAQVVGEHNDLREIDTEQHGNQQQYQKTVGLELRVAGPLQSSYDPETSITKVQGSATVYPFMRPNVADYFITDTPDNQRAIFRVSQVDRKTFNRDSVYSIEYEMVGYVSNNPVMYQDFENKTIRTYHFSKERLVEGLNPTLRSEDYHRVANLKALYSDIVKHYYDTFFNKRYSTLVLPAQSHAIYDSFLVNYLLKLNDTFDAYEIRSIKQIPTDGDTYLNQKQFWDLMLYKDYTGRRLCNDEMVLVSKLLFNRNGFVAGLAYSNIDYVVYPKTPDTSTQIPDRYGIKLEAMETVVDTTAYKGTVADVLDNQYVTPLKTLELIHGVLDDAKYVLSAAFYNDTDNMSVLELLVKAYLQGKPIDLDMLYALCDQYRYWKRLDQYYYAPILMTLVKEADRATY